jgi:hypothetical protein
MYFSQQEITKFWDSVDTFHDPRPVLVKRPFSRGIATEQSLLSILKQWAEAARRGSAGMIDIDKLEMKAMPEDGDQTLDDCILRIASNWQKDWYAYINDVHKYGGELWERAVEIVLPAIRSNGGLPAGGFKMELFFGRYGVTPTGIHLDTSDNLAFIVRGPKRMVFWPGSRFPSLLRIPDPHEPTQELALKRGYQDSVSDAVIIDAEAGDVVYWPKEYWHVGVSAERWTAMITIPMWWNARPTTVAKFILDRTVKLNGGPQMHPFNPDAMSISALHPPETLREPVRNALCQLAEVDTVIRLAWASIASAYGFTVPPAKMSVPALCKCTRVRLRHPVIILARERQCTVFACGHHTHTPLLELDKAFDQLNAMMGTEYTVEELKGIMFERHECSPAMEQEYNRLVSELISFRALELVAV